MDMCGRGLRVGQADGMRNRRTGEPKPFDMGRGWGLGQRKAGRRQA